MRIPLRLWRVGCFLAGIALLVWPADLPAQTTVGKLAGRVIDAQTREALPGVNVAVEGTRLGAVSDASGNYFILQVSPGVYAVKASSVGYTAVRKTDVLVQVDRTVTLNFELSPEALELKEVVVTAERPPVERDVSYTQTIIPSKVALEVPTGPRLRDALATQAGVDRDGWGLVIRGGDEQEILFSVDGVTLIDNRNFRPFTSFSKTALQEVQILLGGFTAEYGFARSGVVNIVTQEPKKWTISTDARYGPPTRKHFGPYVYSKDNYWDVGRFEAFGPSEDRDGDGKPDFEGWTSWISKKRTVENQTITTAQQAKGIWDWQHRSVEGGRTTSMNVYKEDPDYAYDVTVGGPLINNKVSALLSYRAEQTAYTFPFVRRTYNDRTASGKLIFTPTVNTKFTLNLLYGYTVGFKDGNFEGTFFRDPFQVAGSFSTDNIFQNTTNSNTEWTRRYSAGFTWVHTLSPKTFYQITGRFGVVDYDAEPFRGMSHLPDVAVEKDGKWTPIAGDENARKAAGDEAKKRGAVVLDEAPYGWEYEGGSKRDILGIYALQGGGGGRSFDFSWNVDDVFTADLTSQVTPNHQVKGGFQWNHFYLKEMRGYQNDRTSYEKSTQFADYHRYWVKRPFYGGIYLQDKMEYNQVIANVGVRVDYHHPDKYYDLPGDPHNGRWLDRDAEYLWAQARKAQPPTQWRVSPRFGVSHPITADSKLFFNYGHYYQIPDTRLAYRAQSGFGEPLENLGNPWVKMPLTVSYELGYERSFGDVLVASGTAYFKEVEGDLRADANYRGANDAGGPPMTLNGEAKDVRGFEVRLHRNYGRFLTGFASYEFRVERRKVVGWDDIRDVATSSVLSFTVIENNPSGANPRFKSRPLFKLNANFHTPFDYGGARRALLGGWTLDLYYQWRAGAWFNYNPTNDPSLRDIDNAQWTPENRGDLQVTKTFDLRGFRPTLFLEASNVFNFKNFNTNQGRVFEYRGTNTTQNFQKYMEALGWKVEGGRLLQGKKPGTILSDPSVMPRRAYMMHLAPRQVFFGLRFAY